MKTLLWIVLIAALLFLATQVEVDRRDSTTVGGTRGHIFEEESVLEEP